MKGSGQTTVWAIMDSAPRSHIKKPFAQRRKQIVADHYQVDIDVDVYAMRSGDPLLQMYERKGMNRIKSLQLRSSEGSATV